MGATASLALNAAALFSNVSAQRTQAGIARAQGAYAGTVDDQNAGLAEAQAADAIARGGIAESRFRQDTKALMGAQRTALAASGVAIDSGSALDVQADAARLGELDALTIRNNARREAWGYSVDAANLRTAGANARLAGNNAGAAADAGAFSTLLTGGARLADQWMQNPPTFGPVKRWWSDRTPPTARGKGYDAGTVPVKGLG